MSTESGNPGEGWTTRSSTTRKVGMLLVSVPWEPGTSGLIESCSLAFVSLFTLASFFLTSHSFSQSPTVHRIDFHWQRRSDSLGSNWKIFHERALIGLAHIRSPSGPIECNWEDTSCKNIQELTYPVVQLVYFPKMPSQRAHGVWNEAHTLLTEPCGLEWGFSQRKAAPCISGLPSQAPSVLSLFILLSCNWHITLYQFQVYNITICYL